MSRLLVTGTYRDTDLDRAHPLSQALAELNREDLFTRILLRGLTEPETAAYIRDTAQAEPPPSWCGACTRRPRATRSSSARSCG